MSQRFVVRLDVEVEVVHQDDARDAALRLQDASRSVMSVPGGNIIDSQPVRISVRRTGEQLPVYDVYLLGLEQAPHRPVRGADNGMWAEVGG